MDDKDRAAIEAGKAADEFAYRQNISRAYIGVRSLRDLLALAERAERAEAALRKIAFWLPLVCLEQKEKRFCDIEDIFTLKQIAARELPLESGIAAMERQHDPSVSLTRRADLPPTTRYEDD